MILIMIGNFFDGLYYLGYMNFVYYLIKQIELSKSHLFLSDLLGIFCQLRGHFINDRGIETEDMSLLE